jgi:ribosomal protein S18 acetylase RimI-like enzyme
MITFHHIHNYKDPYWAAIMNIYKKSFPIEEQRPTESMERLLAEENRYRISALLNEESEPIGLLTSWNLGTFTYIEHFAIAPAFRSQGYGTWALKAFIHSLSSPMVLEVEPPIDDTTQQRIQFYQRNGLILYEYNYFQPPYTAEQEGVVLRLMGSIPENKDFVTNVSYLLHKEVYGVKF